MDRFTSVTQATDTTDEALLRAAKTGYAEAYGQLFDRHHSRLFRHALRYVSSSQAEDVVALAFLEAWRRRDDIPDDDGRFLPWLIVTASNVARNFNRSERRYRSFLDRLPPPSAEPDPAADIAGTVDSASVNRELFAAFERLSSKDQDVLTLCVLEEQTLVEAGHALGIPTGTVKSRLNRAKRRLADMVPRLKRQFDLSI